MKTGTDDVQTSKYKQSHSKIVGTPNGIVRNMADSVKRDIDQQKIKSSVDLTGAQKFNMDNPNQTKPVYQNGEMPTKTSTNTENSSSHAQETHNPTRTGTSSPIQQGVQTQIDTTNTIIVVDEKDNYTTLQPNQAIGLSNGAVMTYTMNEMNEPSVEIHCQFDGMSNMLTTSDQYTYGSVLVFDFNNRTETLKTAVVDHSSTVTKGLKTAVLNNTDKVVVAVKGASLLVGTAVKIGSFLLEGMEHGGEEAQFALGQIEKLVKKGANKAIVKPVGKAALKGATAVGKPIVKTVAKPFVKVGVKLANAAGKQIGKTAVGKAVFKGFSKLGGFGSKASKVLGALGRVVKAFIAKLKLAIIWCIGILIIAFFIIGMAGAILDRLTSVFGFLFPEDKVAVLYDTYGLYIRSVEDEITRINREFTEEHTVPRYNVKVDETNLDTVLQNSWIRKDESFIMDGDTPLFEKEYLIHKDENGNPQMATPIVDTAYTGKINGVNWKAFLTCVQISSAANYEQSTNADKVDPNVLAYFPLFKIAWNTEAATFLDPTVEVSVKTYYEQPATGVRKDDDLTKNDELGDRWFDKWVEDTNKYYEYKKELDEYEDKMQEYREKKSQYDALMNDPSSATNPPIEPIEPTKPDNYTTKVSYVNEGLPDQIVKRATITYNLNDESDVSLERYIAWFETVTEIDVASNKEMLDHLYKSETMYEGFTDVAVKNILENSINEIANIEANNQILGSITTVDGVVVTGDSELGNKVAEKAFSKLGSLYWWGAPGGGFGDGQGLDNPNTQFFDCSGLVAWTHRQAGIDLPRVTAHDYSRAGQGVSRSELQTGDVVTFNGGAGRVFHIGIYIGDNKVIHASGYGETTLGNKPNERVVISDMDALDRSLGIYNYRRLY